MIPEDAIWILELIRNRDARTEAEKDAVNAAIEALKAQLSQQGTTSDTISRQAAIDAANDWYEGLICGSINGLIKRLNALPTIQPEPQWIPCEDCERRCKRWGNLKTLQE